MKERGIIFSGPMVRRILSGDKTQTRRPLKPQPVGLPGGAYCNPYNGNFNHFTFWTSDNRMILGCGGNIKGTCHWKPQHGIPGDRLWVRETWKPCGLFAGMKPSMTKACGRFAYAADDLQEPRDKFIPWRPSIFLPRWASRITLEITDVRVERLRDISEDDAKAEGVEASRNVEMKDGSPCHSLPFQTLWNQIYGCDAWEKNPWTWCISFKRIEC